MRRRCIEPCSTEGYINALEDIVTRTKIGRTLTKLDIKISNKPFIKNNLPRETFKPNTSNTKINEIVETEEHNDKEEEYYSKKDTEESKTSESDEININNAQIHNIDLMYEVLDVDSNLPQVITSETSLTNIQDAKLYRIKPEKGMGYTGGKSSISIVMVENQEAKVNLDTGAYCTCVGEGYLKTIVPDWKGKPISMKPLEIIYLTLIFAYPSQCISLKVEFVVMENCTSNHLILGNDYLSIYGIDISNQKYRCFTIGDNKRQKCCFLNNNKQTTVIKNGEKDPEKDFLIA
ncbi:hypothetical protein O181_116013 [Austropuccinia psidii MF-1]|uniref:Uncharacterized protein n=1 Tax=Austropuccinia psidii MF-1 TaxID=1389203 RepID=A0A9Q3K7J4_9BASI|nr:hypothetical protein [Austropuccinia psidii MF-1]